MHIIVRARDLLICVTPLPHRLVVGAVQDQYGVLPDYRLLPPLPQEVLAPVLVIEIQHYE